MRKLFDIYKALPFSARLPIVILVFVSTLILLQNPLIFPGAVISSFNSKLRHPASLPPRVSSVFIDTSDGERLELWKLPAEGRKPIAVIFHGNAGDIGTFFPFQEYFSSISIPSYALDYRGYGKSRGWPSERGLYLDAEAAIGHILSSEQLSVDELILVGVSLGSGVASYAAAKFSPRCLILFSPFTSLQEAIRARPIIGLLSPFSFYTFPVKEYVSRLTRTGVIVAHGDKDDIIPEAQGRAVLQQSTAPFSKFILGIGASHNDILFKTYPEVTKAIRECLSAK